MYFFSFDATILVNEDVYITNDTATLTENDLKCVKDRRQFLKRIFTRPIILSAMAYCCRVNARAF